MTDEPTVPRDVVVRLADSYRELWLLKQQQYGTMAEMIRGCIAKIRQDGRDSPAYRRASGFTAGNAALREHKREQAMAFLHLEWLATQLENQSGALSPDIDLNHCPVNVIAQ